MNNDDDLRQIYGGSEIQYWKYLLVNYFLSSISIHVGVFIVTVTFQRK